MLSGAIMPFRLDSRMLPEEISFIRQCLPETQAFPYFFGREDAWLLSRRLSAPMRVRDLRKDTMGKLLNRPLIKPVLAATSDGWLRRDSFTAAALADFSNIESIGGAKAEAMVALSARWFDFTITFDRWGEGSSWSWSQISRRGGNLVLQLGFPSDHARLLGATLNRNMRKAFEFHMHPVRQTGCPTLAWVRLDISLATGEALIEEVQSDWLRYVAAEVMALRKRAPRSRDLRVMERYKAELKTAYALVWPRAAMLAALQTSVVDIGCRTVWMHTPRTGAVLKHIDGTQPPRSLYTDLPKFFCFEATDDAPTFLERKRRRALSILRKEGPIFWRLQL